MLMHLETERLRLQPWDELDAEDVCALHSERENLARPATVERAREVIAAGLAATAETGLALLPIRRRLEGDFIGYCGLIVGRATAEEPEIAYELLKRARARLRDRGSACGARCRNSDGTQSALGDGPHLEHTIVPRA